MSPAWLGDTIVRALGLVLIGLGIVAVLTCGGCSASRLQRATTAATITRIALDATAGGIETQCSEAQVDAHADRLTPCLRAVESHDAARAAWDTWAAALIVAHSDDDEDALAIALSMAQPVLALYEQIAEMLRAFGVDAPQLPPAIASLAGGS